jgi:transposase
MTNDPRADLRQPLAQRGQRPEFRLGGQGLNALVDSAHERGVRIDMRQASLLPETYLAPPILLRASAERVVRDIRRATRKHHSAEDKIRIVLEGLRGEDSIAGLCRREGIAESLYYSWSKEFLEAGKRRLAGDTARAATTDEVKDLRRGARMLKEIVAEQALELRLLKKSMIAAGDDRA